MTNEQHSVELINTEKETNVLNRHQGEFRTSVLDLNQLIHAKSKGIDGVVTGSTKVSLIVTCMDQMEMYPVSYGGVIIKFTNPAEFIRFIGSSLGINGELYMNTSPYSHSVSRIR